MGGKSSIRFVAATRRTGAGARLLEQVEDTAFGCARRCRWARLRRALSAPPAPGRRWPAAAGWLREIGDGVLAVALHAVGDAAVVIGKREKRLDPDRLAVVGDGAIELALVAIRIAAQHRSRRSRLVEPNELVEIGDGEVVLALVLVDLRAGVVAARRLRLQPDRFGVVGDGASLVRRVTRWRGRGPVGVGVIGLRAGSPRRNRRWRARSRAWRHRKGRAGCRTARLVGSMRIASLRSAMAWS